MVIENEWNAKSHQGSRNDEEVYDHRTDTTFKSLFTEEEYEQINKFAKENLMFDIAMMPKVKPAFLSNNLVVILYMKHVGGYNPQDNWTLTFRHKPPKKGKNKRTWNYWIPNEFAI